MSEHPIKVKKLTRPLVQFSTDSHCCNRCRVSFKERQVDLNVNLIPRTFAGYINLCLPNQAPIPKHFELVLHKEIS